MAAKTRGKAKSPRRTTKKKPSEPLLNQIGAFLFRYEVAGIALILIAALTLLSLITDSRGSVTNAWIRALENLVGVGVWGIPFVCGAVGLWMVIFAFDHLDNLAWERPAGIGLMLVAFITGASLTQSSSLSAGSAQDGIHGGLIGNLLAGTLRQTIGLGGAWTIVTLLMICGVVLLGDRFFREQSTLLWLWYNGWRYTSIENGPNGSVQPSLYPQQGFEGSLPPHQPEGRIARWMRYFDRGNLLTGNRGPMPASDGVTDGPQIQVNSPATRAATPAQPASASAPIPSKAPPTKRADDKPGLEKSDLLPARIIGTTPGYQPQQLPKLEAMLNAWDRVVDNDDFIRLQGAKIQETLSLFGVPVSFEGVNQGPTVTQYLIRPGYEERVVKGELKRTKVKVSKISGLANDLALALAAASVRIEAPVPGTSYVGIEVPNQTTNIVGLRELMESESFDEKKGRLKIALGEDVKGNAIVADLARMPHLLIAGATGSGKSSCINSIIACLLCTHTTESLRMLMIDPKMVELSIYNQVPHLLSPVVTEVDKASAVLYWAVKEMERRYQLCSKANCRDLERYNAYLQQRGEKSLPFIVIIVDEMADLMMAAPEEVEKHICRLAQMARAVGIHLIIATQRPSVDVITGLIKANFPSRIAFAVTSQIDSRVILDYPGAERLLGKGDMLFMGADGSKLERMQGTYVSDDEINNVVRYWKGVRVVEQEVSRSLDDIPVVPMDDDFDESTQPPAGNRAAPPRSGSSGPASARQYPPRSSSNRNDEHQRSRPPLSTPGSGRLDLNRAENPNIGGRTSYGAPEEQPTLFEQVDEMKAFDARDDLFETAVEIVQQEGKGSTSLLQRKLRIGYTRASRLVEQLEAAGILSPDLGGTQGRTVLLDSYSADVADFHDLPSNKPRVIGGDKDANGSDHEFWF